MRSLSQVSAPLLPTRTDTPQSFNRRRSARAVLDSMITLVLFKHDETEGQILVSDDDDPVGAVWIRRAKILVDRTDRGRFLVVTMSRQMAQEKKLYFALIDRKNYLPEERALLEQAIQAANLTRQRMKYGSRGAPLHPNATA